MTFLPQEIIRRKRDGGALTPEEIGRFMKGMVDGSVVPAQIGAFAMAVFLNDMTAGERVALTLAMRGSGSVLDWSGLDGPIVDERLDLGQDLPRSAVLLFAAQRRHDAEGAGVVAPHRDGNPAAVR